MEEDRVFPSLFRENIDIKASETSQCFQDGIESCTGVSLDSDLLESLAEGRVVMLLPGSDFTMELSKSGSASNTSKSYSFLLSTGGSATMVVRATDDPDREPSVFGAVQTLGRWMYFVESCGEDCTVIFTRDSNYYNNFED